MAEQRPAADRAEHREAAAAGDRSAAASQTAYKTSFALGGKAESDPNAPKRKDYDSGLGGLAEYHKARTEYSKSKKQADALGKGLD